MPEFWEFKGPTFQMVWPLQLNHVQAEFVSEQLTRVKWRFFKSDSSLGLSCFNPRSCARHPEICS